MTIDGIPFDSIDDTHLRSLIENGVAESITLDYKKDTYGRREDEKREFVADISGFANTLGGHLIIGMDGKDGIPVDLCGLNRDINPDQECVRLTSLVLDGLKPRLTGVQIKFVQLGGGANVIVIRIAKSFNPPHRVELHGVLKFWARAGTRKYEPTVDQLRGMFTMNYDLLEKIRMFHRDRISSLSLNRNPSANDILSGILTLHIIPFGAFALSPRRVAAIDLFRHKTALIPIATRNLPVSEQINIYGYKAAGKDINKVVFYLQAYTNGIFENYSRGLLENLIGRPLTLRTNRFEFLLIRSALGQFQTLGKLGYSPPYAVFVALLNAKGATIGINDEPSMPIDVDPFIFDEVITEDEPKDMQGVARVFRPIFDQLSNGAGLPRSLQFREDGEWVLPQI